MQKWTSVALWITFEWGLCGNGGNRFGVSDMLLDIFPNSGATCSRISHLQDICHWEKKGASVYACERACVSVCLCAAPAGHAHSRMGKTPSVRLLGLLFSPWAPRPFITLFLFMHQLFHFCLDENYGSLRLINWSFICFITRNKYKVNSLTSFPIKVDNYILERCGKAARVKCVGWVSPRPSAESGVTSFTWVSPLAHSGWVKAPPDSLVLRPGWVGSGDSFKRVLSPRIASEVKLSSSFWFWISWRLPSSCESGLPSVSGTSDSQASLERVWATASAS